MSTLYRSPAAAREIIGRYRELLDGWPVPNRKHMLDTCQGPTFVVASGRPENPPLLLLHGAQSNAAAWMFDVALWSATFHVYAVDVIGEAGLSAPSRPPLDSEAHALWLDDVLKGLGVERTAIVGVSFGGWLALDYAARRRDRVQSLALICPAGIGRQKNFLVKVAPLLLLGPWGMRTVRRMVFGPPPAIIPLEVKPFIELMRLIGRHFRGRVVRIPRLSDRQLASLTMPMLVIVGGRDVLLDSNDTRRRLAAFVPHAEVRFLPEARHVITGQGSLIHEFLCRNVIGENLRNRAQKAR